MDIDVADYMSLYLRNIVKGETTSANIWASRVEGLLEGFQVLNYITIKQYKDANKVVDDVRAGRITLDKSKDKLRAIFG